MKLSDIQKTGIECPECGEVVPAELLEGVTMCPECEIERFNDLEELKELERYD